MDSASLEMYGKQLQSLITIRRCYQSWNDHLSRAINRWCLEVLTIAKEHGQDSLQEIHRIAREKLGELAEEILVNPITVTPLHCPVMERDWTWEKSMHEECRQLFKTSPLDGGPMSANPASHSFAEEMIHWHQGLNPQSQTEEQSSSPRTETALIANDAQSIRSRRSFYQIHAQHAIATEEEVALRELMELAMRRLDAFKRKMEQRDEEAMNDVQKKMEKIKAERREKLDSMEKDKQRRVEDLRKVRESVETKSRQNFEQQEKKISARKEGFTSDLASLRTTMSRSESAFASTQDTLNREVDVHEQELLAAERTLEQQLQADETAHTEHLSSIAEEHDRSISPLETRNAALKDQMEVAQTSLNKVTSENGQMNMEVDSLMPACQAVEAEISSLDWKIEQSHRSCVIL